MTKVKLFKIIGKFFDPNLAIVENLLRTVSHLIVVDKDFVVLRLVRNMFDHDSLYKQAPLSIFASAYVDVARAGKSYPIAKRNFTQQDIRCLFDSLVDFVHSPQGLIQRLYRVIQKKAS